MKFQLPIILTFSFFLINCSQLPEKKLSQFKGEIITYEVLNDTLRIQIDNVLHCPLRISVESSDKTTQNLLANNFPLTVPPKKNILIKYPTDKTENELQVNFSAIMGDLNESIIKNDISLPFPKGYKYKVVQAYNGSFSHTSEYSKYAIDFNLTEGDTISAVADGFIVGVIEGYTGGGQSKKWRDYANFITIFHPEMNLYTQYVHLMHNGSFVEVGDYVKAEQAIGRSGKTGYTSTEHLHFNVLKPNESGMQSVPINFKEGYKGTKLKKGDWVEK